MRGNRELRSHTTIPQPPGRRHLKEESSAASSAVFTVLDSWPYRKGMREATGDDTEPESCQHRRPEPRARAWAEKVAPTPTLNPPSPNRARSSPGAGSQAVASRWRLRESAEGDHGSSQGTDPQSSAREERCMTPKRAHSTDQSELDCATATAAEAAQSSGETYQPNPSRASTQTSGEDQEQGRTPAERKRETARRNALAVLPMRQKSAALR